MGQRATLLLDTARREGMCNRLHDKYKLSINNVWAFLSRSGARRAGAVASSRGKRRSSTRTQRPMKKRVTLKDVAESVGVHVSTVSRALNPQTRHLIRPEVAAEVQAASARLGYHPDAAAYSLKTRRTRMIGVVVPDITNSIFPPIIRGIDDELARHDYIAIVANTDGDREREASITTMLRQRGVDGLILASVERVDDVVEHLAQDGVPIVTVNRRVDDPGIASVAHDEDDGMRQVLAHLGGLGHRHVATIAGPPTLSTGRERLLAFNKHRRAFGLDTDPALVVVAAAFNETAGERSAEELLGRGVRFTAIACSNDRLAIGAIAALNKHGLVCPRDVSVTGYNDMPMVDRLAPPLTTIRVQQYRVGERAAEMLVAAIEGKGMTPPPRHLRLPVELIVRGSTGAPGR